MINATDGYLKKMELILFGGPITYDMKLRKIDVESRNLSHFGDSKGASN